MGTTPLIQVCEPSALTFSVVAAAAWARLHGRAVVHCAVAVMRAHGLNSKEKAPDRSGAVYEKARAVAGLQLFGVSVSAS